MKLKKLLSAVAATAIAASAFAGLAVTASADYSSVTEGTQTTLTWDFGEYTEAVNIGADGSDNFITYEGLTLVGNNGNLKNGNATDYVSASGGFHMNGNSSTSTRHILYTPSYDGKLTVSYMSNNSSATDRVTAIGTEVKAFKATDTIPESVLAYGTTDGYNLQTIEANLTKGTQYYIFFANGGQNIRNLTYTYTAAELTGEYYAITVDDAIVYGEVKPDKTEAQENDQVTLTVTPSEGYELDNLTVDSVDVTDKVANGSYTFTMPGHAVDVTASFKELEVKTLQAVSETTTWDSAFWATKNTGGNSGTDYKEDTIFDNIALNALSSSDYIRIYDSNLYLSGTGNSTRRNVSILPAEAGTLKVEFSNGNSTERFLVVYQDAELGKAGAVKDSNGTLTVEVKAGSQVYMYSAGSGLYIDSITYTPGATLEPEAEDEIITQFVGKYDESEEDLPTAAFAASITAANDSEGITWEVKADGASMDPVDYSVTLAKGTEVIVGFIVTLTTDGAQAATFTDDSLAITVK